MSGRPCTPPGVLRMAGHRPTILVADDQPIVADALTASLERWFEVLGTVTDLDLLENAIVDLRPDILLLDLAFGKRNSLSHVKGFVERYPGTRIVVLTAHAEPVLADAALKAGAMAFVVKQSAATELKVAIADALAGKTCITLFVAKLGAGGCTPIGDHIAVTVSDRQRKILGLLRAGHTYEVIANQLEVSTKTVEYHVYSLTRRLGIKGKSQLIRWSERFFLEE